jgi:hypothetical protein
MRPPHVGRIIRSTGLTFAILACVQCCSAKAAEEAKIKIAIQKAQRFLIQNRPSGAHGSIAMLAYVKSGAPKSTREVQQIVEQIVGKISVEGIYRPGGQHNYEASVDLMMLETMDPEAYREHIQSIVNYLLKNQQPNGSWYYDHKLEPDCGDTSITQYVMMALWAATRAGIEIPIEVWEQAARWHIERQMPDGGFAYHPFQSTLENDIDFRRSTGTMTAAGTSSLLILRRVLFDEAELAPEIRPPDTKRRFGVLEKFVDERPSGRKKAVKGVPTLRVGPLDKAIKDGFHWMGVHWGQKDSNHERHFAYHLYTIERVTALMDVQKINGHDWYDEGSDELLQRQANDGSWTDIGQPLGSTAMALMFLTKATTTIVAPRKRPTIVGGGLQAGGRGLPDNLDAVQVKEGAVAARKLMGPVDNLLIELERSSEAKVEDIQAAVVEAVQLDRPDELIGQIERLRRLSTDPRVEVRRTAVWALGRSGDQPSAKWLIQTLSDPDPNVVREASLALCFLTRRVDGCGLPIDPLDDSQMGLDEDTSDEVRSKTLESWKVESKKRWSAWYQTNRPYDERDDRSALKKNSK